MSPNKQQHRAENHLKTPSVESHNRRNVRFTSPITMRSTRAIHARVYRIQPSIHPGPTRHNPPATKQRGLGLLPGGWRGLSSEPDRPCQVGHAAREAPRRGPSYQLPPARPSPTVRPRPDAISAVRSLPRLPRMRRPLYKYLLLLAESTARVDKIERARGGWEKKYLQSNLP